METLYNYHAKHKYLFMSYNQNLMKKMGKIAADNKDRKAIDVINDYYDKTGKRPLWTNSLFGGMPSFQISFASDSNIYRFINKYFTWSAV